MQLNVSDLLIELRSALRFRWQGMFIAWIVCLVGWWRISLLPDQYQATARVYVDTTSVLSRVLGDQIRIPEIEGQISYIREALLGREQLEAVVDNVGFGIQPGDDNRREGIIASLGQQIQIDSTGGDWNTPDNIYSIRYQSTDQSTAENVVSELLDSFVATTIGENRRTGETAGRFLDERVGEYEVRLAEAEAALASFKRENADKLPGAEGDYYQRMRSDTEALALANRELRLLETRAIELRSQLDTQAAVVTDGGLPGELPANSLDARVRDYETQLDLALLQYTEKHPEVIRLRETLEHLKGQRAERLAALGLENSDVELFALSANPVRQAIEMQLNETEVEIASLRSDIADRTQRVSDFQGLIDELPQVEAQLAQLNRDYEVVYEQYIALVRSREAQELTIKVTDTDLNEFRIIDPPMASSAPIGTSRIAYYGMTLVAAFAIAAALAYYCAQLWPVFGSGKRLRAATELPILGVVTHAWQDQHLAEVKSATSKYMIAVGALMLVFAVFVGSEFLRTGLTGITGGAS